MIAMNLHIQNIYDCNYLSTGFYRNAYDLYGSITCAYFIYIYMREREWERGRHRTE